MSWHIFDEILASLRYTNRELRHEDGFFHMMQMEEARKKSMADEFNPYWINVIGKIMMEWYNNPPPMGSFVLGRNHIILEMSTIKYALGLHQFFGSHIFSRGRIERHSWTQSFTRSLEGPLDSFFGCVSLYFLQFFFTDSGFCVANGIFALAEKGVYDGALIKKHWNWPKSVPGDLISRNFADKEVGDVYMSEAEAEDGNPFRIFCFEDTDYVMKIMASWMTHEAQLQR